MKNFNEIEFNELPEEIKEKALDILKAYDEVSVIFEYGKYNVTTGCCIKSVYAPDHKVCGRYFAKDLYTKEQRYENYKESFGCYPRVKIFG